MQYVVLKRKTENVDLFAEDDAEDVNAKPSLHPKGKPVNDIAASISNRKLIL